MKTNRRQARHNSPADPMGANMGKNSSLLDALPSGQGTLHVVMLGLDSAGKTTALYRLKFDQYLNTVPTIGFNCEKVKGMTGRAKGVNFLVWDVGGQEKLRPLWKSYTRCTDGIVFVLDSVDVERMEEAKMELIRTVKSPENVCVPILVLANKQDLPGAKEPRELEKLMGLTELAGSSTPGGHLWHVQPACAITGEGLQEGIEALYEMILKRRKLTKMNKKKSR
ncbi:ADP-ribosylation factor-like protein 4C [Agrilus planipennis]|uniref:ADP-ribosylation factor-like protein 11 n=1 Tax=Agrilus planipennis TaxID=224129 RepID=A0A1W4XIG6_AGRPL|nr:ADP-ribosylation factor-like protein 4C [Agrilus planipennis]